MSETQPEITVQKEADLKAGNSGHAILPEKLSEFIMSHRPAATDDKGVKHPLPPTAWSEHELDAFFKWSDHDFDKFSKYMGDLLKTSELYESELSRRSVIGNPEKLLLAGSSLATLANDSPMLSGATFAGLAGLQAYDDFKNMRDQRTVLGFGKYGLGIAADAAMGLGGLGYLVDAPLEYKAPLLFGGLVVRGAMDIVSRMNFKPAPSIPGVDANSKS
jgi:hypothetical protein